MVQSKGQCHKTYWQSRQTVIWKIGTKQAELSFNWKNLKILWNFTTGNDVSVKFLSVFLLLTKLFSIEPIWRGTVKYETTTYTAHNLILTYVCTVCACVPISATFSCCCPLKKKQLYHKNFVDFLNINWPHLLILPRNMVEDGTKFVECHCEDGKYWKVCGLGRHSSSKQTFR